MQLLGAEHFGIYRRSEISDLLHYPFDSHLKKVEVVAKPQYPKTINEKNFLLPIGENEPLWVRGKSESADDITKILYSVFEQGMDVSFKGVYVAFPVLRGERMLYAHIASQKSFQFLMRNSFVPGELRLSLIQIGKKVYDGFVVDTDLVLPTKFVDGDFTEVSSS
jgi:hypothetical protein